MLILVALISHLIRVQVTGIIWAPPGTQFGPFDADTETLVGTINNQMDANVIGLVRLAKALDKDLIATKVHGFNELN